MTMLVVDDLFSGYGKSQVLHGVSLSVDEGEIVALIGANGAGKTTTFYLICGLLTPDEGEVILDDNNGDIDLSTIDGAFTLIVEGANSLASAPSLFKQSSHLPLPLE